MRSKLPDIHRDSVPPLELAHRLLERMEIRLAESVPFTPGSFDIITEMKSAQLPLALVSASTRPLMNAALRSIGEDLFDVTISDTDVSQSKPHPEGYLKAAESLSVDIQSCLIIEDSITGMNAAISSGAYVIGLPHVADLPRGEKVVHRLSLEGLSLAQIPGLFNTILERQ
jgi:HAD superfamily hydrolase (TIGR01509 family)